MAPCSVVASFPRNPVHSLETPSFPLYHPILSYETFCNLLVLLEIHFIALLIYITCHPHFPHTLAAPNHIMHKPLLLMLLCVVLILGLVSPINAAATERAHETRPIARFTSKFDLHEKLRDYFKRHMSSYSRRRHHRGRGRGRRPRRKFHQWRPGRGGRGGHHRRHYG